MCTVWWRNNDNNTFLCVQAGYTALIVSAMKGLQDIIDLLLNVKDINVMKGDWVSLSIERLS